jgi:hypothetical protein
VAWVFLGNLATEGVIAVEVRERETGAFLADEATGISNADKRVRDAGAVVAALTKTAGESGLRVFQNSVSCS